MNILEAFNTLNLNQQQATIEDIKKAFRKQALKYHPDRCATGHLMMIAINDAYKFLLSLESEIINCVSDNLYDYSESLQEAIQSIIDLDGLIIEVCGNWIWVSGNTKEHKEVLKFQSFKWSKNKSMWYFRPEEYARKKGGKQKSIDEIREAYGSKSVNSAGYKKISNGFLKIA